MLPFYLFYEQFKTIMSLLLMTTRNAYSSLLATRHKRTS